MSMKYTDLIDELRAAAKMEQLTCEADGICFSGHVEMLRAAADAIETLNNGIKSYADAAFEAARTRSALERLIADYEAQAKQRHDERDDAPVYVATRADILRRAAETVSGQRVQDHGTPEDNFAIIAQLWTAYSGHPFCGVDVAMMMALLKIARIRSGNGSEDSFVDLAGYAACGGELWARLAMFDIG